MKKVWVAVLFTSVWMLWLPDLCGQSPTLLVTESHIDFVKNKISAGEDPWLTAWNKVQSLANSDLGASVGQPFTGTPNVSGGPQAADDALRAVIYIPMMGDMNRVVRLAWAYQITGDTAYADKAEAFIRKWTQWSCASPSYYYWWSNILLDIPYIKLVFGLDMIDDSLYFTQAEKDGIRNWVFSELQPFHETLHLSGVTTGQAKSNPWNRNRSLTWCNIQSWNNTLEGLMGLLYGHDDLVDFAVNSADNRYGNDLLNLESMIQNALYVEPEGCPVNDWYRSSPYDPHRTPTLQPESLGYPAYHLQAISILCQALKNSGKGDYFAYVASTGANLKGAVDYLAPRLDESSALGKAYTGWNTQHEADLYGVYKLILLVDYFKDEGHQFLRDRVLNNPTLGEPHIWAEAGALLLKHINWADSPYHEPMSITTTFDDSTLGAWVGKMGAPTVATSGMKKVLALPSTSRLVLGSVRCTDQTLLLRVAGGIPVSSWIGILLRAESEEHDYTVTHGSQSMVFVRSNGRVDLMLHDGTLVKGAIVSTPVQNGDFNMLVETEGARVRCWIDGEPALDFMGIDNPTAGGFTSIRSYNQESLLIDYVTSRPLGSAPDITIDAQGTIWQSLLKRDLFPVDFNDLWLSGGGSTFRWLSLWANLHGFMPVEGYDEDHLIVGLKGLAIPHGIELVLTYLGQEEGEILP